MWHSQCHLRVYFSTPMQNNEFESNVLMSCWVGYRLPRYYKNEQLTTKSDVFSFGIVLLELICGRKSINVELPPSKRLLTDWVCCFSICIYDYNFFIIYHNYGWFIFLKNWFQVAIHLKNSLPLIYLTFKKKKLNLGTIDYKSNPKF